MLVDDTEDYRYGLKPQPPPAGDPQPDAPRPPGPTGRGAGEMGFVEEDEESQDEQTESEESEEVEEGPHVPLSGSVGHCAVKFSHVWPKKCAN